MRTNCLSFILISCAIVSGCINTVDPSTLNTVTVSVSEQFQNSALLGMKFNAPVGGDLPTCGFEVTSPNGIKEYSAVPFPQWSASYRLKNLAPGVRYDVRAYAALSGSKLYSETISFTPSIEKTMWVSLKDFNPVTSDNSGYTGSCIVGERSCYGLGDIYDAATDSWIEPAYKFKRADQSFPSTATGPLFMQGGSLYRFADYNDFLESIDTTTLQLTSYPNDSLTGRLEVIFFATANAVYVGGGHSYITFEGMKYYNDLWKFDFTSKQWQKLADLPFGSEQIYFSNAVDGKGYVAVGYDSATWYTKRMFWEYDPNSDAWERKSDPPALLNATSSCIFQGQLTVLADALWSYTRETDEWRKLDGGIPTRGLLGTDGTTLYVLGVSSYPVSDYRFWKYTP